MNRIKFTLAAALIGLSTVALAEDVGSDSARQERMDAALQNYHGNDSRNTQPGTFARAEASTKRGMHRAGSAIKHGAQKVGHAVGTGARKTGDAIRHTGEKIQSKTSPKP
jgi:hypothetical protein